jgi:hypothetical protein
MVSLFPFMSDNKIAENRQKNPLAKLWFEIGRIYLLYYNELIQIR